MFDQKICKHSIGIPFFTELTKFRKVSANQQDGRSFQTSKKTSYRRGQMRDQDQFSPSNVVKRASSWKVTIQEYLFIDLEF